MESRFLEALRCRNTGRPPVWLMRQAGRYLPQYRAIREKYSFETMCQTPEIAAAVTRLPVDILGVDAAILFSDILVVADAMGLGVKMKSGIGPVMERPLKDERSVSELPVPEAKESLFYVFETIRQAKSELSVPLIGFAGAPFTVASYMIEKGTLTKWLNTEVFCTLLEKVTELTIDYLMRQIEAGVDALQLFDSWAKRLSNEQYAKFSLPYIKKIVDAVGSFIPLILYSRGPYALDLAALGPAAIGVDESYELSSVALPTGVAIQGNLPLNLFYQEEKEIRRRTRDQLLSMKDSPGYIVNSAEGLRPDIKVDAVKAVVDTVKDFVWSKSDWQPL